MSRWGSCSLVEVLYRTVGDKWGVPDRDEDEVIQDADDAFDDEATVSSDQPSCDDHADGDARHLLQGGDEVEVEAYDGGDGAHDRAGVAS